MAHAPRGLVAVLQTRPDRVLDDYDRLFTLGQAEAALPSGITTILKDNISWHFPFPGANTTPWQLEGAILALQARGYTDLVCVQNQTVVTDAFKGEDLNGYRPILERHGVPVRYNFRDQDMRWVPYEPKRPLLALHQVYPQGVRIPDYFPGKNVLHLPTVKCHIYTTTTGAMKNAFGGLLHNHRHYAHSWIHETLVDLLAIQQDIHPGLFAVMDGTTAGNGPGPRTMEPQTKNVLLASADQVAIDAVAAKMMGFDPLRIPYIRLAHEAGLGVGDPRQITVVGDEDAAQERWGFRVGENAASRVGHLIWFGPLRPIQRLFMRTPLVNVFVLASELYHDYYRWPSHDRRVFEHWLATSEWGALFREYRRQGALRPSRVAAR